MPVLILPFVSPADAKYKEMGRDIQQDLASAIAADLRGQVSAPASSAPAADAAAALAVGRETHSSAVIFGRAQVNNDQVRLAGQVLDVNSGKTLGSLNQSGPIGSLFHLEDDLTQQVVAALPEGLLNLRGLLSARPKTRPQIIYLPSDAPIATPDHSRPIDGGYAGPFAPYTLPPAPGGPPPYSPDAGSYPYRFVAPYAHLIMTRTHFCRSMAASSPIALPAAGESIILPLSMNTRLSMNMRLNRRIIDRKTAYAVLL